MLTGQGSCAAQGHLTKPNASRDEQQFIDELFADLVATINAPKFTAALAEILADQKITCSGVSGSEQVHNARQRIVHERVNDTVKVTLSVDGHRYKPGTLELSCVSFVSIANAMPEYDLDELFDNLASSARLAEGASLHPRQIEGALKVDRELNERNLLELRDEAGVFCRCVGALQDASRF